MNNPSFEPIYAALFSLLTTAGQISFTGTLGQGSPVVTGCSSTGNLWPGLAIQNPSVPVGTVILTVDSPSQITMTLPANANVGGAPLVAGYATTSRLLRHWGDVPANAQPALYQAQLTETQEKRTGQPGKSELDLKIYIYCQSPQMDVPTSPTTNALLALVRGALGKDKSGAGAVQNRQTLGGLVFDTWINGKIETDEGVLGQQGVAIVPIRILENGP
jgi:hypothetical protein